MRLFEETPRMGILRNLLYGVIIALIYAGVMIPMWKYNTEFLPGYLLIGVCLSFFGWAGERLWLASIGTGFKNSSAWNLLASRMLIWAMFGGMGYTIAITIAVKYDVIYVQLIPIKNMFFIGAHLSCIIQLFLLYLTQRKQQHITKA